MSGHTIFSESCDFYRLWVLRYLGSRVDRGTAINPTDKTPNIAAPNCSGGIASTQPLSENPMPAQRHSEGRLFSPRSPMTMESAQIVAVIRG